MNKYLNFCFRHFIQELISQIVHYEVYQRKIAVHSMINFQYSLLLNKKTNILNKKSNILKHYNEKTFHFCESPIIFTNPSPGTNYTNQTSTPALILINLIRKSINTNFNFWASSSAFLCFSRRSRSRGGRFLNLFKSDSFFSSPYFALDPLLRTG